MRDTGSYLYTGNENIISYFSGTRAHNTVAISDSDQMERGSRFIWYNWSKAVSSTVSEEDNLFVFEGTISAFKQIKTDITHTRKVTFSRDSFYIIIEDSISGIDLPITQIWHPSERFFKIGYTMESLDSRNNKIEPVSEEGWFSNTYGVKEPSPQLVVKSPGNYIRTTLTCK